MGRARAPWYAWRMGRHRFRATALALALVGAAAIQCGGSVSISVPVEDVVPQLEAGAGPVDAGPLPPPTEHRPFTMACPVTRPAGLHRDAGLGLPWPKGPCNADSECVPGVNGRCTPNGGVYGTSSCTFDVCFIDDDCADAGGPCICGATLADVGSDGARMRGINQCFPGNCRVDADCGPGGLCSMTVSTCGQPLGFVGYYCRTPNDTCTRDEQCLTEDPGPRHVCAWRPALGRWACGQGPCSGGG